MTDKKWAEYQELVLSNLERLDQKMEKLEGRALNIEKCIAKLAAENKITLAILVVVIGGIVTMAFTMLK